MKSGQCLRIFGFGRYLRSIHRIRFQKGISYQNRLLWELKVFYPSEFAIGVWAIERIKERMQIELPEEEAGNIAYHIVNAQSDNLEIKDTIQSIKMLKDILSIIGMVLPGKAGRESNHYFRMVTHLQFFRQRVLEKKMLKNQDAILYQYYIERYPEAYQCTEKIANYVQSQTEINISEDEKFYILLHLVRSSMES